MSVHMRFVEYPTSATINGKPSYMIRIGNDEGLQTLSKRLGFAIFNRQRINVEKLRILLQSSADNQTQGKIAIQTAQEEQEWIKGIRKMELKRQSGGHSCSLIWNC